MPYETAQEVKLRPFELCMHASGRLADRFEKSASLPRSSRFLQPRHRQRPRQSAATGNRDALESLLDRIRRVENN
jgi:hypothetical protein